MKSAGTIDDLLADAAEVDLPATERMITDWISVGLLDHPKRRSRGRHKGSDKALFSAPQRKLFGVLLDQRNRTNDGEQNLNRMVTLANIPVWMWLTEGDAYVPLRQVRRALKNWADAYHRVSEHRATYSARELVRQLAHPSVRAEDKKTFLKIASLGATSGTFDRQAFLDSARKVIDPNGTGIVTTPQAALIEDLATSIEARYVTIPMLDALTDRDYQRARWIYRQNWRDDPKSTSVTPVTGIDRLHAQLPTSTLQQQVNGACNHLLGILGLGVLYARDHPPDPPRST